MLGLGILVVAAVWFAGAPVRSVAETGGPPPDSPRASGPLFKSWVESPRRRLVLCGVGGALVVGAVGGWAWLGAGALGGAAVGWWVGRLEPPSVTREREEIRRALPLAVELLAACARAGQPWDRSVEVVAGSLGGPLGALLGSVAARVRLGMTPAVAWRRLAVDAEVAPLARVVGRSLDSGAPLAASLTRLSADLRAQERGRAQQRARSVGVKAAGPLAACFLPAFMVVGVVPTVAGAFAHLLG